MSAWSNPVDGKLRITSKHGYRIHPITKKKSFHDGIDIAVLEGTPVKGIFAMGVVTKITDNPDNAWGLRVDVKHRFGYRSFYAHLSRIDVSVGQAITQNTQIGLSGDTGTLTTGPHLHFGMGLLFASVNPLNYIPG